MNTRREAKVIVNSRMLGIIHAQTLITVWVVGLCLCLCETQKHACSCADFKGSQETDAPIIQIDDAHFSVWKNCQDLSSSFLSFCLCVPSVRHFFLSSFTLCRFLFLSFQFSFFLSPVHQVPLLACASTVVDVSGYKRFSNADTWVITVYQPISLKFSCLS